jgi:hypothetical protein
MVDRVLKWAATNSSRRPPKLQQSTHTEEERVLFPPYSEEKSAELKLWFEY